MSKGMKNKMKVAVDTTEKLINSLTENEYLDISHLDENTKKEFINNVCMQCSKDLLKTFLSCGLKTHMEQMITDEITGKEYILTFQTLEHFQKRFKAVSHD